MKYKSTKAMAMLFALTVASTTMVQAESAVEVMHFWTTGGEAAALNTVKSKVESQGVKWTDSPVAGGGGDKAKTVLQARMAAGNPPTAMLMLGYNIIDWAEAGLLTDLNDVAEEGDWDTLIPQAVQKFTKVNGDWVSAPTNIHRVNMVWGSSSAFEKIGAQPPKTWDEFNNLAPKLKAAGIIPLAHGGQAWQDMTLFDSVALGIGGIEFYQKAFIDLDNEVLGSATMIQVFDQMRILRSMVDDNFSGRDWNVATSMIIEGKAAMQIMGDWAKGEFTNAGKTSSEDFLCFPAPGTDQSFVFLVNSFSMFKQTNELAVAAQNTLAKAIMDPEVQLDFNIKKGSIPANSKAPTKGLDACALQNVADLQAGTSLPTVAYSHATSTAVTSAITDVVTRHFNSDLSSEQAVQELLTAVAVAM